MKRWLTGRSRWLLMLAFCLSISACGDSSQSVPPTSTNSVPGSTPAATAAALATPQELVTALGEAWTAGNEGRLTELAPASASELLSWGRPEFVSAVSISDCTLGPAGAGRCELLVGIDGLGLLFDMAFSEGPDGALRIDLVTFAGDAG